MNRIFKALMCFVLILSIMQLGKTWMRRYEVEKASNKVDIIVEYNDFEKMVEIDKLKARTDIDIKWWLLQLKNYGATSVAIIEDTILSLIQQGEDVDAKTYRELKPMLNYLSENELRSRIQQLNLDNYDIVIQTSDKAIYNRIVKSFQTYYEEFLIDNFENQEVFYIILDSNQQLATKTSYTNNSDFESKYVYSSNEFTEGKLLSVGIGLDPNKVAIAKEVGLTIIPRLNVNLQSQTDKISAYKDIVREFELDPTIYISADKEVIGYPQRVSEFANYIREENMTVLLIETNVQRNNLESPGQETLIKELDNNNLARGLTMSRFIQQSYQYLNYDSSQEITNILYRAITERNIRAIYFRPFLNKAEYVTDIQAYEDTLKDLGERLKTHNLSYGTVKPYENISTTYFENIFMSLGLLVALLVLMNQIIKTSQTINVALLITGVICISGAYFLAPNLSLQIITLGYSVIIPTLGITMMNKKVKHYSTKKTINTAKLIVPSALQTIKITLISMLGGLFLYGLMAQTSYLVEIDLFRGVKIGQLLPIFLVVVIVLVSFSEQSQGTAKEKINYLKNGFKRLMNVDLKIKYIIILLIVGTVGYIYIARTGHESNIKVSQIEIMIRNFLENTLPVRPRTKEMLIGIPALFLCIYFANRFKYTISSIMVIIATIGQASILNTFQHQRTAMDISITRTLFGLGIGILIGLLYLSIIELGKMALKKIKCSKKKIN